MCSKPAGSTGPEPPPVDFLELEKLERCILCEATELRELPWLTHVVRCGRCRHLMLSPRPTQPAIAASYDLDDGQHTHWIEQERGRRVMWHKRIRRTNGIVGAPGRALDIGAGFGTFLATLREEGWDVTGTEVSGDAVETARQRHGIELLHCQLEEADLADRSFDLITLWHVLEHVPWPGRTLSHCARLLAPGGWLCIAVPNDSLFPRLGVHVARESGRRLAGRAGSPVAVGLTWPPSGCAPCPPIPGGEVHLSFFAPRRLARHVRSQGFEINELDIDDYYAEPTLETDRKLRLRRAIWRLTGLNVAETIFVAAQRASGPPPFSAG